MERLLRREGDQAMRVGLIVRNYSPETGGGHTFEDDVFRALVAEARFGRHDFFVFGEWNEVPAPLMGIPSVSAVSIYRPLSRRFSDAPRRFLLDAVLACLRKVAHPRAQFRLPDDRERRLSDAYETNGIEMSWAPGPGRMPMEQPFITTVWDLQHRLQAFFPEVSNGGVWSAREEEHAVRLRRAAFILTGTQEGKAEIERFYGVPEERIRVVPFPTPAFALEHPEAGPVPSRYGVPEGYLLYPSQFWPHKNHINLLRAIRLLRDATGKVFPVVFIGSDQGNREHVVHEVRRLGLTEQVHFLGFVPREDLSAFYRNAFALVYASCFGPDNLPPLEAFALGCPVVASDVPGSEEQLGDASLRFDPFDPSDMARVIGLLASDPALRELLVARGKERARRWTGRDYVRSVIEILDEFEAVRRCWGVTKARETAS